MTVLSEIGDKTFFAAAVSEFFFIIFFLVFYSIIYLRLDAFGYITMFFLSIWMKSK